MVRTREVGQQVLSSSLNEFMLSVSLGACSWDKFHQPFRVCVNLFSSERIANTIHVHVCIFQSGLRTSGTHLPPCIGAWENLAAIETEWPLDWNVTTSLSGTVHSGFWKGQWRVTSELKWKENLKQRENNYGRIWLRQGCLFFLSIFKGSQIVTFSASHLSKCRSHLTWYFYTEVCLYF